MMIMKIAAVGDNCVDFYQNIGKAFPGGNPVNVAVYLARLGAEASYTGVVGDDEYGKLMVDALNHKGVDTSHVRVLPGRTAITYVELLDGERVLGDYDEGVLEQFKLNDADIDFLAGHDLIVSGLWGKIENDLEHLHSLGTPIAFDFADKLDDPVIEKAIRHVDYAFFASDQGETRVLRDFMVNMHKKGPKIVTVTLGEKGSISYDGEKFIRYGIIPCNVIDTMGAGDSFIAGFLKGILEGKDIKECMHMGALNSSVTVQYKGAW
ncbi:UNVERIFIED_ORG: fructoselysine 6-kinase [Heyndrickxia coagulans]